METEQMRDTAQTGAGENGLLTISEAAALVGLSVRTLRRWDLEQKIVPAQTTQGGHRRYRREDVLRIARGQKDTLVLVAPGEGVVRDRELKRMAGQAKKFSSGAVRVSVVGDPRACFVELLKDCLSGKLGGILLERASLVPPELWPSLSLVTERHKVQIVVANG